MLTLSAASTSPAVPDPEATAAPSSALSFFVGSASSELSSTAFLLPFSFAHFFRTVFSQATARSFCRCSDQVRIATMLRSRLYSWTGLRKTGAGPVA